MLDNKNEKPEGRMNKLIGNKFIFQLSVSLCIAIAFYFILGNLDTVGAIISKIAYYLYPIIAGIILAYLVNPLMKFFENKVFGKIKKAGIKRAISLTLSMLVVLVAITAVIIILVPCTWSGGYARFGNFCLPLTMLAENKIQRGEMKCCVRKRKQRSSSITAIMILIQALLKFRLLFSQDVSTT